MQWLKKLWQDTAPESVKPVEPETWVITMYRPYTDVSYGIHAPSISYEAISSRGDRISKYIYNSGMTKEHLLWMLNKGKKPGKNM